MGASMSTSIALLFQMLIYQASCFAVMAMQQQSSITPQQLVSRGTTAFKQGHIEESIKLFDEALEKEPRLSPYLWQRGLSLYYAERFQEGALQFRRDVMVNPNDTEEAVWCALCEAQLNGFGKDPILTVGKDPRPVMRSVYDLFAGRVTEAQVAQAGLDNKQVGQFYAALYLGLYAEVRGEQDKARHYILNAVNSPYGSRSSDYMAALAQVRNSTDMAVQLPLTLTLPPPMLLRKVHAQLRGWKKAA
ncbi:unnamed protein product [Chrysoparadoxa australica]